MHRQAVPSIGRLEARLDDHVADAPRVGAAFLDRASATGVKTVCVHWGLGAGSAFASPVDVGAAATAHPDIRFVVVPLGLRDRCA